MIETLGAAAALAAGLLCLGGFVGSFVLLVRWNRGRQRQFEEAVKAAGFEPVTGLSPDLARRLVALSLDQADPSRVVCPQVRREAGYTVLLQGIQGEDALATWELGPAVHAPGLAIPRLNLVPKGVAGERLTRWASKAVTWRSGGVLRSVEFPEDPEFESLFGVLGADESAVRAYLDGARRASLSGMPDLVLTGEGDLFTFGRYGRTGGSGVSEETRLRKCLEDAAALIGVLWG